MCPVVVGTDIVGSIRNPASFAKAYMVINQALEEYHSILRQAPRSAGPIARSVEDAALLLNVISAPDSRDPTALPCNKIDYMKVIKGGYRT